MHLRVFGVPLSIDVPVSRFDELRAQWSWCLSEASTQRTIPGIGGLPVAPSGSEADRIVRPDLDNDPGGHVADYRLTTAITGRAISACSGQLLMFHAAGLLHRESNRVIGLVAPSGTGKTTATHRLCSTPKFAYVTDESLVVNDVGDVLPYPKPLSIMIPGSTERSKSQHGPSELGFTAPPPGNLKLGPLVVLNRVSSTCSPALAPMSIVEGLKAVLPQSSAMPLIPDCLELTAELARRGGGFQELTYYDINDAIEVLEQAFTVEPPEHDWVHVAGNWPTGAQAPSPFVETTPTPAKTPLELGTALKRTSFIDAILAEDLAEGLVLIGSQPMHLRGLGPFVWMTLESPHCVKTLIELCEETFGDHPDAEKLVVGALMELETSGVITRAREADAGQESPAGP